MKCPHCRETIEPWELYSEYCDEHDVPEEEETIKVECPECGRMVRIIVNYVFILRK